MTPRSNSLNILEPGPLDRELSTLPPPPSDLPKPWKWSEWQRWLVLGFPVIGLALGLLARALFASSMPADPFGLGCAATFGIFLWLGLFLMNRFGLRGFYANYAAKANRPLNNALRRYKRKKPQDAWLQLFPRYEIDGRSYYLVWYVPGYPPALVAHLSGGAEPLLFDQSGQWLDDEDLFHKVILMWSYALDLSPRGYPFLKPIIREVRGIRKAMVGSISKLPRLLELNEERLAKRGFRAEVGRIRDAFEAKCAYMRNGLHILDRRVEWGDAYGWDSLTLLRYDDILAYHEATDAKTRSRMAFVEKHRLKEAEAAALRIASMLKGFREQFKGWRKRKQLFTALVEFADPHPAGDLNFTKDAAGWKSPEVGVQAYRSRVAYARQIDAELHLEQERAEVAQQ